MIQQSLGPIFITGYAAVQLRRHIFAWTTSVKSDMGRRTADLMINSGEDFLLASGAHWRWANMISPALGPFSHTAPAGLDRNDKRTLFKVFYSFCCYMYVASSFVLCRFNRFPFVFPQLFSIKVQCRRGLPRQFLIVWNLVERTECGRQTHREQSHPHSHFLRTLSGFNRTARSHSHEDRVCTIKFRTSHSFPCRQFSLY